MLGLLDDIKKHQTTTSNEILYLWDDGLRNGNTTAMDFTKNSHNVMLYFKIHVDSR